MHRSKKNEKTTEKRRAEKKDKLTKTNRKIW